MIQLQHLDGDGKNIGGLYVDSGEIAAVYAVCRPDHTSDTYIVLRCGREFRTAQSVSELLTHVDRPRAVPGEDIGRKQSRPAEYLLKAAAESEPVDSITWRQAQCRDCGWLGHEDRVRKVHRPLDPGEHALCPDCGSERLHRK